MFKQILVPLDGSTLSESALPAAKAVAAKFDGEITIVRATSTPYVIADPDALSYAELMNDIREQNLREVKDYLKGLKGSLRQEGYTVRAHLVENASPANAILAAAEAQHMDVIVMSTHGRGGIARWVFGSIADKVVRHSPVPILLIRAQDRLVDADSAVDKQEATLHSISA